MSHNGYRCDRCGASDAEHSPLYYERRHAKRKMGDRGQVWMDLCHACLADLDRWARP